MASPFRPAERLIVALDVPSAEAALRLVSQLEGLVSFYKVGLELYAAEGPEFVRALASQGLKIFLDLKFLDIDETVRRATRQVARLGVSFLTVHESGKAVAAAVEGAKGSDLKILAVTVLTSMSAEDVKETGWNGSLEDLVLNRAQKAVADGCHGVVASGQEASKIHALWGHQLSIVTPGIRPSGSPPDDQKRTATPAEAIAAGADYLVVGRPIRDAKDPHAAAQTILNAMQEAWVPRKV